MRYLFLVTMTIFSIFLAVAGVSAESGTQPSIHNIEAPGNLESKHELGCIAADKVESQYTPIDLLKATSLCAKSGMYKEGTFLFAVAGVYGRFDTLRVEDKSAHQAVAIARMVEIGSLDESNKTALQESLKAILGSQEELAAVCEKIVLIGPPSYYPRYMIQHGMGAFSKSNGGDGLVENFDVQGAWNQSLESYLHCPNLN